MYILKDILIELKYLPIALAAGILIGGVLLVFSRNRRRTFLSILCTLPFAYISSGSRLVTLFTIAARAKEKVNTTTPIAIP